LLRRRVVSNNPLLPLIRLEDTRPDRTGYPYWPQC